MQEKCKLCWALLNYREINVPMVGLKRYLEMCSCEEEKYQEEQRMIQKRREQEILKERLEFSNLAPRFQERTFENWKQRNECNYIFSAVRDFAQSFPDMRKKGQGVLIVGEPGNGKTHLAAAVVNYLIPKFYKCLFTTVSGLLDRITYINPKENTYKSNLINDISKLDLLVLDDFGKERYTETRLNTIFDVINTVYEYKIPIIITMNPDSKQKLETLPEMLPVLDRIQEMCAGFVLLNDASSFRNIIAMDMAS